MGGREGRGGLSSEQQVELAELLSDLRWLSGESQAHKGPQAKVARKELEWEEEKVEELDANTKGGVDRSVPGEGTEEARRHGPCTGGLGEELGVVGGMGVGSAKEGALEEKKEGRRLGEPKVKKQGVRGDKAPGGVGV